MMYKNTLYIATNLTIFLNFTFILLPVTTIRPFFLKNIFILQISLLMDLVVTELKITFVTRSVQSIVTHVDD